jgi:hypothetical protein
LRKVCLDADRLILIDTLGEHSQAGYVEHIESIGEIIERMEAPTFRLGYCPSPNGYDEVEYLERVCASRWDVTLAIDEMDKWYQSSLAPLGDGLAAIVNYGRHFRQGIVATVRRPTAISRDLRSQGTLWIFPMRDDRDRAYVYRNTGIDGGGIGVAETDSAGRTVVSEVIRREYVTQVLQFNLQTGALYDAREMSAGFPPAGLEPAPGDTDEVIPEESPSPAPDNPGASPDLPQETPE